MAAIRCKACGRVYHYEKNGTCPKCGAYNRPPRKEIVAPDGTIHYVTTENKVCYEEKECYEEEVRQRTDSYHYTPEEPVPKQKSAKRPSAVQTLWQHRNAVATAGKQKKVVAIMAIISALGSLVGVFVGNLSAGHSEPVDTPWESVSVEPAGQIINLMSHIGGTIYTDGGAITINSYEQAGSELECSLQTISKTNTSALDSWTIDCYYETPTDQDYLYMDPLFSDGEHYTFVATLPDGINASDCAVVLDIPFDGGINRYWVWLETPTYERGEDFYLNGQRLFVSEVRQSGQGVDVSIDCKWDIVGCCEVWLNALNVNDQPYTATWSNARCTINMTDGRNTSLFNFTLRNVNDVPQSITLLDIENQRQAIVNLQ